jgi:hypothetical protein
MGPLLQWSSVTRDTWFLHYCSLIQLLPHCVAFMPLTSRNCHLLRPNATALQSLPGSVRYGGRPSREEALQAVAVINRIRRLLATISGGRMILFFFGGGGRRELQQAAGGSAFTQMQTIVIVS